jgi:hypothetical protein
MRGIMVKMWRLDVKACGAHTEQRLECATQLIKN